MWKVARFAGLAAAAVGIAGVASCIVLNRDRSFDRDFDARVARPAFRGSSPVVLFDEAHLNSHTTDGAYKPFADLVRNDGFEIRVLKQAPLSDAHLAGVSVLVIAVARGSNATNDSAAYSASEEIAIQKWVAEGGSLLLVTDHWPYGSAVMSLARRFNVAMGAGLVQDTSHYESRRGDSHLIFSIENGLLRNHPIVEGRGPEERVRRVLTFTGQSVQGPDSAVAFLALSSTATERPPRPPRVDSGGGDVRVSMEYGDPLPVPGRAQAIAMSWGAGRVVVLGEAGMIRAQRTRGGELVGMHVPGYDNRQLAVNIMRWLARHL